MRRKHPSIPLAAGAAFRRRGPSLGRRVSARKSLGHSPPGPAPAASGPSGTARSRDQTSLAPVGTRPVSENRQSANEQLAGERHDHHPADPPAGSGSALVEPLAERAIRLIAQPAPRHLDELCPDSCWTVAADPLVALRSSPGHASWRIGTGAPCGGDRVEGKDELAETTGLRIESAWRNSHGSRQEAQRRQAQRSHIPIPTNRNRHADRRTQSLYPCASFPGRFEDITAAIAFCRSFFPWYNTEHRHAGIAMLTPDDVHHHRVPDVLAQRGRTLQAAWALHPERFVHGTPKPAPLPEAVWINPPATSTTGETSQ